MNRDYAIGFIVVALLLGGIFLLARRPAATSAYASVPNQHYGSGKIAIVAEEGAVKRYRNKEIRRIEYNGDGLPTLIEITRDYAIT